MTQFIFHFVEGLLLSETLNLLVLLILILILLQWRDSLHRTLTYNNSASHPCCYIHQQR